MGRSSNDDRSDRYNPNNDAYWAAEANEAAQRGDDDDDDALSSGAGETPASAHAPRVWHVGEISVSSGNIDACLVGDGLTLRRRMATDVVDRASHFVLAIERLLNVVIGYQCEQSQSAAERKAIAEHVHRVIADREAKSRDRAAAHAKELEKLNSALDAKRLAEQAMRLDGGDWSKKRATQERAEREVRVIQQAVAALGLEVEMQQGPADDPLHFIPRACVVDGLARQLRECLEHGHFPTHPELQQAGLPTGWPRPKLSRVSLHEALPSLARRFVETVHQTRGASSVVMWKAEQWTNSQIPSSREPGEFVFEQFESDDAALDAFIQLHKDKPIEQWNPSRACRVGFMIPCSATTHAHWKDLAAIATGLDDLFAGMPEAIDPRLVLRHVATAVARAEYARVAHVIVGMGLNPVERKLLIRASGAVDARSAAFRSAEFRAGLDRAVAMPLPIVSSVTSMHLHQNLSCDVYSSHWF